MTLNNSLFEFTFPEKGGLFYTKLSSSSEALAVSQASYQFDGILFVLTATAQEAEKLLKLYQFFAPNVPHLIFPAWETLPYDHFSPHQAIISERLLALSHLPQLQKGIVIAPISTVLQRLAPTDYLAGQVFALRKGQKLRLQEMRERLQRAGYHAVSQVALPGEYAVRGSLFDIYPMAASNPFRIDLFDDEIDSIKIFNSENQRSLEELDKVEILPAHEFPMNEAGIKVFREHFREAFAVTPTQCSIYQAVSNGETPAGIEYYLPLFFDQTATIFDYLPKKTLIVAPANITELAEQEWQHIRARFDSLSHDITRPILPPAQVFLAVDQLMQGINNFSQWQWVDANHKHAQSLPMSGLPNLLMQPQLEQPLAKLKEFVNSHADKAFLFTAESQGRRENFLELLRGIDVRPRVFESFREFLVAATEDKNIIGITVAPLEEGFAAASTLEYVMLPEAVLLGQQVMQARRRKSRYFDSDLIIRNLAELSIGDAIVHIDHGIGRYQGLEILTVADIEAEFLKISYEGGNLYVPVTHLQYVSRYSGMDPEHAPLHRLGSDQWQKAKRKAAEKIRDVAAELLALYAQRAARQGYRYQVPDEHYLAFAASFPFEETPDQVTTIEAVIQDMTSDKPMDRLICGDVGFGKTEVAMRAAFLAVQSGKQVAVLVPTTLLAQQHYETFSNRFANWPVKIDVLSRFRTPKEQQHILDQLAQGQLDIVIGTHKLIQNNIHFYNLGLAIIDEEHRFGVRQKERLKTLRSEVDILTMTATPIPRTLNMAMSQVRELSIIATPPAKRLAIKTFVRQFEWHLVREAISRETLRGGQVYFLHNEVATIQRVADELKALMPELRLAIAHGQLHERELEQIMSDFYHQRFNVLLCTTIIETGIDVPNANTIIINRADKFGLAQLHQLRGRVGRSHHQAYAYLLTPPPKTLTSDALRRLEAIEELEELGVGFVLATHDLEIRGAGEILGEDQSGQMQAIGYNLYTEMLDRAVHAMQHGEIDIQLDQIDTVQDCELNLQIPALIPDEYLSDVSLRLIFYKRIASAVDLATLRELKVELVDRFGKLPQATHNLFAQMELKWQAKKCGIKKLEAYAHGGRIEFNEPLAFDPIKIINLIQLSPQEFRFDGPNRIKFSWLEEVASEDRIDAVKKILARFE